MNHRVLPFTDMFIFLWPGRESNPQDHRRSQDFKSCVFTSFTTKPCQSMQGIEPRSQPFNRFTSRRESNSMSGPSPLAPRCPFVPHKRLELLHLSVPDPKSGVSTIPPTGHFTCGARRNRTFKVKDTGFTVRPASTYGAISPFYYYYSCTQLESNQFPRFFKPMLLPS